MVDNEEYCLDITQQSQAVQSALKKADEILLEHHLQTCVKDAFVTGEKADEKVQEIMEVFKRKWKCSKCKVNSSAWHIYIY